jgi:hypothetical protein
MESLLGRLNRFNVFEDIINEPTHFEEEMTKNNKPIIRNKEALQTNLYKIPRYLETVKFN